MKFFYLSLFVLTFIYSCSSISKKYKSDYYVSKVDLKRNNVINGQLSLLKCTKDFRNEYTIKFNKSKDSLTFNSSVNLCELLKDDLLKGSYIISDVSFNINTKDQKLKYRNFQYGVFDSEKNMLFRKSGGVIYCFIKDLESFKKTIHYKLTEAKFNIIYSTISLAGFHLW